MTSNLSYHSLNLDPGRLLNQPIARISWGKYEQVDERDIVFARSDLYHVSGEDSPEFQEYYAQHPEWLDIDIKTNRMPGLGRTGDIDSPMMDAQFAAIQSLRHFGSAENAENEPGTSIIPHRAAQKIKSFSQVHGRGFGADWTAASGMGLFAHRARCIRTGWETHRLNASYTCHCHGISDGL